MYNDNEVFTEGEITNKEQNVWPAKVNRPATSNLASMRLKYVEEKNISPALLVFVIRRSKNEREKETERDRRMENEINALI